MKQIKLTQGKIALVDDENFDFLNQWKWYYNKPPHSNTGYALGYKLHQRIIEMHRLIMGLEHGNKKHIDHRDGNGCNNQKSNLRICTHAENLRNRKPKKNGTSKYLGVAKLKLSEKRIYWQSRIYCNKKNINLGTFPYTKEGEIAGAKAYNEAAKKYHGEFARLNKL